MYGPDEIIAFAAQCDYLVIAAPLTDATRGMVNAEVIAAMKPSAAIVNVSRGEFLDESALRAAFASGRISRAGMDAHAHEPLPEGSPWWDQPGVIVTPHNGATTDARMCEAVPTSVSGRLRSVSAWWLRNLAELMIYYA
jgi:phosphoglycerate dehydrogenase-like enzyme